MSGYRKLGRASDQRRAMLRGLVTNVLKYGKVETTLMRAKDCLLYTSDVYKRQI